MLSSHRLSILVPARRPRVYCHSQMEMWRADAIRRRGSMPPPASCIAGTTLHRVVLPRIDALYLLSGRELLRLEHISIDFLHSCPAKHISGSGFNVMKIAVVRYAKMLKRYIESTTPLEWSADFSIALHRNTGPWSLQEVSQLLVTWRVTGWKLGAPGILISLFSTSK